MRRPLTLAAAMAVTALPAPALAYPPSCAAAQAARRDALAEARRAAGEYTACLAGTPDDAACAREFRRAKSAQAKLQDAADDTHGSCPPD